MYSKTRTVIANSLKTNWLLPCLLTYMYLISYQLILSSINYMLNYQMKLCLTVVIKYICTLKRKKENLTIFGVVKVIWLIVLDIRAHWPLSDTGVGAWNLSALVEEWGVPPCLNLGLPDCLQTDVLNDRNVGTLDSMVCVVLKQPRHLWKSQKLPHKFTF